MRLTVGDFEAYLDQSGLRPTWRVMLDVVNCASTTHEIEGGAYLCPAQGGAYQHSRARFFGMYSQKAVRLVAEIEGVVDLVSEGEEVIRWKNVVISDAELKRRARKLHQEFRDGWFPLRVFVLGPRYSTQFWKDSKGGMLGSKRYFYVDANTAEELADQLRDKEWSKW